MMASTTCSNDGGSRKRPATGISDSSDPFIGLNVGGKIFYTHRSTLTNGSPYFAARFGGSFGAENSATDENGRDVYCIDANPELFEHVLDFLRRGIPTWSKNLYKEDPVLFKRLVGEAEYFGIDSMLAALQRWPIRFEPDGSGKDILYWLGTDGGKEKYENPLDIGAVSLGGTCFENEDVDQDDEDGTLKNFTQHRPLCRGGPFHFDLPPERRVLGPHWYQTNCDLLPCEGSYNKDYLDITFEAIAIRPTHYSLRYEVCYGMTHWDFQASIDGLQWTTLHRARRDRSIAKPSEEEYVRLEGGLKAKCEGITDASTRQEIATSIVEEELRHVWKVKATKMFYRYFRLKGAGENDSNSNYDDGCMHGVGFELYGEVEEL